MGNRGDLTNEQWERIEPLLPKAKTKRGRPAQDHRKLLNGIVWVLRTGAPWRDMPERYGKWTTIYSRFQRWRKSGVWDKMFAELQTCLGCGEQCGLGDPLHRLHHGASPPTCCRCKKSSPEREALGRSRGGFSTKIHVRCEGTGRLITFLLTPGQESDIELGRRTDGDRCYSQTLRADAVCVPNVW